MVEARRIAGLLTAILVLVLVWSVVGWSATADGLTRAERCEIRPDLWFCENVSTTSSTTSTLGTTTTGGTSSTSTEPPSTSTTTLPTTTTTVVTSTSSSSSTTTLPPGPFPSSIAAIGCSNTAIETQEYLNVSTQDRLVRVATGGDTISWWAGSSNGWTKQYLPNGPYTGAWINLCEKAINGLTESNVQAVIDKIRLYSGDVPIWVSPLNFYVGEGCAATNGNEIPNAGAVLADQFAAGDSLVFRGPDLGPLGPGMLRNDNCHPNSVGSALIGAQLVAFFDQ